MKKKLKISTILLYITLFALLGSYWCIHYFQTKIEPGLLECAEDEVKRLTTLVVNNSIKKYLATKDEVDNLLKITRNKQNEIELIQYDTKKVNQISTTINTILEKDLTYMIKGEFNKIDLKITTIPQEYYEKIKDGIIFSISVGTATGNSLLANLGPRIPLSLSLIGNVISNIDSKITEYGLNNAMIEIFVQTEVTTRVHMPFLSKKVKVTTKIPLTMEVIQGNIPSYYLGSSQSLS